MAIYWQGWPFSKKDFTFKALLVGLSSALFLYVIFYLGKVLAPLIFPFAQRQIVSIYELSSQGRTYLIAALLLFVTSPGEEIFWRFFLQNWAMEKYGQVKGYLLTSFLYAAVHLITGNLMLFLAALTAGLFWGFIYLREKNVLALIISHGVWTVSVFLLVPLK